MHLTRILCAGAAGLLLVSAMAEEGVPPPADPASTPAVDDARKLRQDASYIIGADIAQKVGGIIGQMDLDKDQVLKGLGDVLSGKEPAIAPDRMGAIMQRFQEGQKAVQAEKAAKEAAEAPKRKEANLAFLAENGKRAGVTTTASGLQYQVLATGAGASPKMGDQVSVNYTGSLVDGTVFDASERHGGAATFAVGQVIQGWNEALTMMKEGDKWKLTIPAELAYGEHAPPSIGPNQVLIFEVELLKVMPKS
jgi:FKBP-type peptidyl-prolyl cis-trans isomerase